MKNKFWLKKENYCFFTAYELNFIFEIIYSSSDLLLSKLVLILLI